MTSVAAIVIWTGESGTLESIGKCELVKETALVATPQAPAPPAGHAVIQAPDLWSRSTVLDALSWFAKTGAEHLLWCLSPRVDLNPTGLRRLAGTADDTDASIVYGDYYDRQEDGAVRLHPLIDYQLGSLRDDFDFGPVFLLGQSSLSGLASRILQETPDLQFGGLYDLRLRLAEGGRVVHLQEPVCQLTQLDDRPSGQKVFDYVNPRNRDVQLEMEQVATAHLQRIGARLDPPVQAPVEDEGDFAMRASVVIPVKNRAATIAEAASSALNQKTTFDFNVIVVDNHSDDGTTDILQKMAKHDRRLVHLIPPRRDLQIGGCWNQAVCSSACGRFAVQLDSDDLYSGTGVLGRIVGEFDRSRCALVIGAYTTVNFDLQPMSPGLIDHQEWTDTNGHNNALRIAGLGAPRAYHVPTLRTIGFPDVSYGEDYAVVLRLCRTYRVGRIYDSLYLCRRWEENSDSHLPLVTSNRYDSYKDRLRTIEIVARQKRKTCPR